MNKRWNTCVAAVDVLREAIKESDLEVKNSNMILPEKEGTAKAIVTIKNPDFDEVDSLRTVGEAAKAKAEEKGFSVKRIEFMPIIFTGDVAVELLYNEAESNVGCDCDCECDRECSCDAAEPEIIFNPIAIKTSSMKDSTWKELQDAIREGRAMEVLQLGDEIDITTKHGHAATVQVVHIKHNEVYFALKDAWEQMAMVDKISDGKLLSWAECNVRKHLQEKVLTDLPDDMAAVISKRTIKQNIGSDVKITEDKLWLLSHTEVFGRDDRADADDTDEFHFDFFNDERSRVKQRNGETDWWTLRTPRSGSSTYFRIVNINGTASSYNATSATSVCFGFCIK